MQREVDTNPELREIVTQSIAEYLKRLYYDTVCFEAGYLKYVADVVGPERLILGSDGPFPLGEPDPVSFIQKTFPDNKIGWNILHANAAKMFSVSDKGGNCGDS
jgi:aminocarboxymuconate-semialdehyde decarboxylase